jgi:hypothetical protein
MASTGDPQAEQGVVQAKMDTAQPAKDPPQASLVALQANNKVLQEEKLDLEAKVKGLQAKIDSLQADKATWQARKPNVSFPQHILNFGFYVGLILAGLSLVATIIYLGMFLHSTSSGIETIIKYDGTDKNSWLTKDIAIKSRLYMGSLCLVSCGIMVGLAFGFLGFGLFLIGVRDVMDAEGSATDFKVKLANISPGLLLLLCATLLIGFCATHQTPFQLNVTAPLESSESPIDPASKMKEILGGIGPPVSPLPALPQKD